MRSRGRRFDPGLVHQLQVIDCKRVTSSISNRISIFLKLLECVSAFEAELGGMVADTVELLRRSSEFLIRELLALRSRSCCGTDRRTLVLPQNPRSITRAELK